VNDFNHFIFEVIKIGVAFENTEEIQMTVVFLIPCNCMELKYKQTKFQSHRIRWDYIHSKLRRLLKTFPAKTPNTTIVTELRGIKIAANSGDKFPVTA
jgi:hypothetical protein